LPAYLILLFAEKTSKAILRIEAIPPNGCFCKQTIQNGQQVHPSGAKVFCAGFSQGRLIKKTQTGSDPLAFFI
jgi:hypothetical protein